METNELCDLYNSKYVFKEEGYFTEMCDWEPERGEIKLLVSKSKIVVNRVMCKVHGFPEKFY